VSTDEQQISTLQSTVDSQLVNGLSSFAKYGYEGYAKPWLSLSSIPKILFVTRRGQGLTRTSVAFRAVRGQRVTAPETVSAILRI
jgi:hypothetical protein